MKRFTVIHILLFLLVMSVYPYAQAQDYLVLAKGDTIRGEIKPITYSPEKKVQITTPDKKKTLYSIFQMRSFFFKGETYQPVRSDKGYVFMKLIKPGYLSLFAFQMENQTTYDGLYLMKRDGSGLEVPNLTFKKQMTKFLSDCEDVSARIDHGDLGKRSIDAIVDEYNACIANHTADYNKTVVKKQEQSKKTNAWDVLEDKVKNKADFSGKADALEMIADIKNKIRHEEKIPNFLLEGLKSTLASAELNAELQTALDELKNE